MAVAISNSHGSLPHDLPLPTQARRSASPRAQIHSRGGARPCPAASTASPSPALTAPLSPLAALLLIPSFFRFVAVLYRVWGGLRERFPFTSSLHPPDLSGRATLTILGHDFAPRHAAAHALTGPPLFARSRRSIPYPILPTPPPSFPACPSIDLLGALWRRICPTLLDMWAFNVGFGPRGGRPADADFPSKIRRRRRPSRPRSRAISCAKDPVRDPVQKVPCKIRCSTPPPTCRRLDAVRRRRHPSPPPSVAAAGHLHNRHLPLRRRPAKHASYHAPPLPQDHPSLVVVVVVFIGL